MDNGHPEAYITGIGLVTPIGVGRKGFWTSLLANKSGVGPITLFDLDAFDTKIAAECADFDPKDFMDRKTIQRTDRFTHFALASTLMAMDDADAYKILEQSPEHRLFWRRLIESTVLLRTISRLKLSPESRRRLRSTCRKSSITDAV